LGYLRVKEPKPDLHSYADWLFLFYNGKRSVLLSAFL